MYSDSDDSQLSQPHLFIRKKSKASEAKATQSEDVVDREQSNSELINFSEIIETNVKDAQTSTSNKPTNLTDKLLIKFSSNSSSESPESSDDSISTDDETSLGEVLDNDEEEECKLINKSQQTSPTLLAGLSSIKNFQKSVDWTELKKYASINSLESTVHSPEIAPFQSKYLRTWQQQQRLYFDQKKSFESLDTMFDSKLNLNMDSMKATTSGKQIDDTFSFKRKQYGIFNFEFDEELFYKVKKLFPQVSDEKIRTFMYKHHNQEHDVIAATINSLSPKREKRRLKHQSAMDKVLGNYIQMHRQIDQLDEERKRLMAKDDQDDRHNYAKVEIKIRYLKLLYPKVEILDLFYYLHNCDMKANNVAKKLEELGYERKTLSESEESLADSLHIEELMPELKLNFGEQQNRVTTIQREYPSIDIYLVKLALKSTKFNMDQARKLLDTVDLDQYKNMKTYEFESIDDYSKFTFETDRGTQTSHIDYIEYGGTRRRERKTGDGRMGKCKSTWTKEDKMERVAIKQLAKGPDKSNVKGSTTKKKSSKCVVAKGTLAKNHLGNDERNVKGRDSNNVKGRDLKNRNVQMSEANGPDPNNCKGSFKDRPKNWLYDDESNDEQSYMIKMDDFLPMSNMFSNLSYLSNY